MLLDEIIMCSTSLLGIRCVFGVSIQCKSHAAAIDVQPATIV